MKTSPDLRTVSLFLEIPMSRDLSQVYHISRKLDGTNSELFPYVAILEDGLGREVETSTLEDRTFPVVFSV